MARRIAAEERVANSRASNRLHLAHLVERDLLARFDQSNMVAGPCQRAQAYHGELFDPEVAPIPPFDDCPHPDQCGCLYSGFFDLPDE